MKTNTSFQLKPENFVESLQRNPNCTLLYGKNNVYVQSDGSTSRIPGYLSLHNNLNGQSVIKWTPNFLMKTNEAGEENSMMSEDEMDEKYLWRSAMTILADEIKYIHFHQQLGGRGTIVLVSRKGFEWPPLHFYDSCYSLAFLSSLEKALLPSGRIDPPVSKYKRKWKTFFKIDSDKSFQTQTSTRSEEESLDSESEVTNVDLPDSSHESDLESEQGDDATDFVFHVRFPNVSSDIEDESDHPQQLPWEPNYTREALNMRCKFTGKISRFSEKSDIMRRRILSCVFYQWLAYCRQMKSLRHYLKDFVHNDKHEKNLKFDDYPVLTEKLWNNLVINASERDIKEICKHIYAGGCDANLRKKVWPYLLEFIPWDATNEATAEQESVWKSLYSVHVDEWNDMECYLRSKLSSDEADSREDEEKSSTEKNYEVDLVNKMTSNYEAIERDLAVLKQSQPDLPDEFFTNLRQIVCILILCNANITYFEGICDLLAVMLKTVEDKFITYGCAVKYIELMKQDFTEGDVLDAKFANLRALIQLLDPELFDHMRRNGDYTHLYFTKRWFLVGFTKEFSLDNMAVIFETMWASKHVATLHFQLFIALAMLQQYRDTIIQREMGFVDVRNFFSEKMKKHDVIQILDRARGLINHLLLHLRGQRP